MTFKELVINFLVSNGMFDSQAQQVFNNLTSGNIEMNGRWNDRVDDYPAIMKNIILVSAKQCAAEWIAQNAPMAWYRPMFED